MDHRERTDDGGLQLYPLERYRANYRKALTMTPGRRAAKRGGWGFLCPGLGRLLAMGFLVTAVCGPPNADEQAVAGLLQPLGLASYLARPKPPYLCGPTS